MCGFRLTARADRNPDGNFRREVCGMFRRTRARHAGGHQGQLHQLVAFEGQQESQRALQGFGRLGTPHEEEAKVAVASSNLRPHRVRRYHADGAVGGQDGTDDGEDEAEA